jgi:hypothetical protein
MAGIAAKSARTDLATGGRVRGLLISLVAAGDYSTADCPHRHSDVAKRLSPPTRPQGAGFAHEFPTTSVTNPFVRATLWASTADRRENPLPTAVRAAAVASAQTA